MTSSCKGETRGKRAVCSMSVLHGNRYAATLPPGHRHDTERWARLWVKLKRSYATYGQNYQVKCKAFCSRTPVKMMEWQVKWERVMMMEEHNRCAIEEILLRAFCLDTKEETGKQREFSERVRPRGRHESDGLENTATYCCRGRGRGRRVGRSLCAKRNSQTRWLVMTVIVRVMWSS